MRFHPIRRAQENMGYFAEGIAARIWANRWETKAQSPHQRSILTIFHCDRKKLQGEKCRHCGGETLFKYNDGKTTCHTCGDTT